MLEKLRFESPIVEKILEYRQLTKLKSTYADGLSVYIDMDLSLIHISTIDVYGTFFIMAMFYFMLRYAQTSFYDTEFKKTLIPLFLSGLMMGLGCASKWTAVYAAAGLAVFFAAIMLYRYMEYLSLIHI